MIVEYGPKQTAGVSQLQYVHGLEARGLGDAVDDFLATNVGIAIRNGLLAAGILCLVGVPGPVNRWVGVTILGATLVLRRR